MDLQLENKRALVTGSTAGIGKAVARLLAREGALVVVHGRNKEAAEMLVAEITGGGGRCAAALGDLSSEAEALHVAKTATKAFGGIDILINNAGGFEMKSWLETSAEKWTMMLNGDVLSAVRLILHLLPGMKERKWGRVIQIASSAATQPNPYGPDYCAAKAALVNLSVSLAKDLAGTGITSNTISPGTIRTEGVEAGFRAHAAERGWGNDWDEIERKTLAQIMPANCGVGRVGRPEEVASLVALVASPLGAYINGANLRVDGGYVVSI